jgi:small subunit ribosomal protein S16
VAVKIRLKRMGKVRAPHYRIVAVDSRKKRDGRVLEELGTYNPKAEPSIIHVDSERAQHWLSVGAQPSTPVAAILKLTGDWQKHKGEGDTTPTLRTAEPRRDKTEIFNEALKEAHDEPSSEAVTKKAAPRKAAQSSEATGESVQRADKAHAEAASGDATADATAPTAPTADASTEQPGDQPAEQPAEQPTEQPAEQPKSDEA